MRELKNKDTPEDNEQRLEQTLNIDVLLAISDENVYRIINEALLKIKAINIIERVNTKEELLTEIKDKLPDIIVLSTDLKGEENLMYLTPKIPVEIRIIGIDTVNINRLIYGKMQEDGVEFLDLESIESLEALIFPSEEDDEEQEETKQTNKKKKKAKDINAVENSEHSKYKVIRGKKSSFFTKQIMNASTLFSNMTSKDEVKIKPKKDIFEKPDHLITEDNKKVVTDRILGNISIGIGGAGISSGTTHTALSVAAYLKKLGQKVAVLEFNGEPKLKNLIAYTTSKNADYLTVNGIDIYYQKGNRQNHDEFENNLIKAKSESYKYIILDLGVLKKTNDKNVMQPTPSYSEMWRTDHQILCVNGALWGWNDIHFYRCDDFAEVEPNIGAWSVTVNLATDDLFNEIKKEIKNVTVIKNIVQAPTYFNPFNVDEKEGIYLENLIKDVIPNQILKGNNTNNLLKFLKKT